MKITFESKAWISQYNLSTPDQLRTPQGAASLYYSQTDLISEGYTFAGTASITLELVGERALVDNKVAALREQAASIRADATVRCTQIEGKIQQLMCIENSPAGAA